MIYRDGDKPRLEVKLEQGTVWLTQSQMVELFESSKANVSEHIKNIYEEGELRENTVVRKFRTTAQDGKTYNVAHYNLDMIISLGYRIKSHTATQFRMWATGVLREYTLQGVAVNQKRLDQLGKYLDIVSRSEIAEVSGVGEIVKEYIGALHLLEEYDDNRLSEPEGRKESWKLTYEEARTFLEKIKKQEDFGENFANERSEHFGGVVAGLYQTFGGKELYKSVEEKAANLLYQVVKDHPFVDGNKRSAAALFIFFLSKNGIRSTINSNALAATILMVALSDPSEKDQMILLVRNFLDSGRK